MAYEDEPPPVIKPEHVSDDAWRARYGDYVAALALYRRVWARAGDETPAARTPTVDQQRAEDNALAMLKITRTALLNLYRPPHKSN